MWRDVWKTVKLCVTTPTSGHTRGESVTLMEDPSRGEALAKVWSGAHIFIQCAGHLAIHDRVLLRRVSVKCAGLYKSANVMDSCLMCPFSLAKLIIIYQFLCTVTCFSTPNEIPTKAKRFTSQHLSRGNWSSCHSSRCLRWCDRDASRFKNGDESKQKFGRNIH